MAVTVALTYATLVFSMDHVLDDNDESVAPLIMQLRNIILSE